MCRNFYANYLAEQAKKPFDFAIFFDKDIPLAKHLERLGVRVFNSAKTIELCDDKEKTYSHIKNIQKVLLPKTICSPLMYDINDAVDTQYLDYVESQINYPLVIKENVGSQGRQVYLANNNAELCSLYKRLKRIPHCIQEFIGTKKGSDIRVYIVGTKSVAAVERINTTDFRSNVAQGGALNRIELSNELSDTAQSIANALNLEYGSVDFILNNGKYYFIEANTSVYMKKAIAQNIELDKLLTDYIVSVL